MRLCRSIVYALACLGLVVTPGRGAMEPTAFDHLRQIVALSPAPEYRRAGSPGMVSVANYAAARFAAAGYHVVRHDFPFERWEIDYAAGHEPLLRRSDGVTYETESAFDLDLTTPAAGITCVVRRAADAGPGRCGFIPFGDASPEWKNSPFVSVGDQLDQIVAAGGAGAIVQGDTRRDLVFAIPAGRKLPVIVAVAGGNELLGRTVTLRTMGRYVEAVGHNIVAVKRPPAGSNTYVMLLSHGDGWFQAAADNGGGAAAVIRAAELLSKAWPGAGVIAAITDAEEIGLIGADRLAEAFDAGLAVGDGGSPIRTEDINAIVNLDASSARASDVQDTVEGLARQDAPLFSWRAMVFSEGPIAGPFLARFAAHQVLGAPVPSFLWKPIAAGDLEGRHRSDVASFEERGIPFVWPVAGYPEYHTNGDDLHAVDPTDLENIAIAAAELMRDLAGIPLPRVPETLR